MAADDQPAEMPDWLAALRHPTQGDLKLSPYWRAPEQIPGILKAFGPRRRADHRLIVLALDDMAISIWGARKHKLPMKFEDAKKLLAPLETRIGEVLTALELAAPLHQAIYRARIAAKTTKERRELIALAPVANDVLLAVRMLRDPNGYRAAYHQPAGQKSPERALLLEPLFDLMNKFGLRARDFSKHQPLLTTLKKLHLAIGIAPPNDDVFDGAVKDRRKKEAEAGG